MRSDVIHALSETGKAEIATINSIADGKFEVLTIIILPENRGAHARPKTVIPESIETPLREKPEWKRQLLADDEEAFVSAGGGETGPLPALVPKITGVILIFAHEVPVGNILDTVHTDTVDAKIAHPARDVGVHQSASGRFVSSVARDWVVRRLRYGSGVAEYSAAEAISKTLAAITAARCKRVRISRMPGRAGDIEIVEIDP